MQRHQNTCIILCRNSQHIPEGRKGQLPELHALVKEKGSVTVGKRREIVFPFLEVSLPSFLLTCELSPKRPRFLQRENKQFKIDRNQTWGHILEVIRFLYENIMNFRIKLSVY